MCIQLSMKNFEAWILCFFVSLTHAYKAFENKLQGSELDCDIRQLAYDYALQIQPFRGSYQKETFDALELHTKCGIPEPPSHKQFTNTNINRKHLFTSNSTSSNSTNNNDIIPSRQYPRNQEIDSIVQSLLFSSKTKNDGCNHKGTTTTTTNSMFYIVDPVRGNDFENDGTCINSPFKTIYKALYEIRKDRSVIDNTLRKDKQKSDENKKHSISSAATRYIIIREGTVYLNDTIILSGEIDSNIVITSYPNETVWFSGGIPLYSNLLNWSLTKVLNETSGMSMYETIIPNNIASKLGANHEILSMFTSTPHTRLTRCRYPNGNYETYSGGEDASSWLPFTISDSDSDGDHDDDDDDDDVYSIVDPWWIAEPFELPQQVFKNLSCNIENNFPCKNNSQMWQYNLFTYGYTSENQTKYGNGSVADLWYGKGSYWTGLYPGGGWAFEDQVMGKTGIRHIPIGMTINLSISDMSISQHNQRVKELKQHILKWTKNSTKNGIIHVWHDQSWFIDMFSIDPDIDRGFEIYTTNNNYTMANISFIKGGYQGGRVFRNLIFNDTSSGIQSGPWLIDNIFQECDYYNEWYFDNNTNILYYIPNITQWGNGMSFINATTLIIGNLTTLFKFEQFVNNVTITNINFRDTKATFMDNKWGVPSGGDWSIYYGGAFELENTTNIKFVNNIFSRLDGSVIFIYGYNRNITISKNQFEWIGDNVISLIGKVNDYNNGYSNNEQPKYTYINENLAFEMGLYQAQSSFVFQSKAYRTYMLNNTVFNIPRAGILFNDGFAGGNYVSNCLLFNTCRLTGDHGPINSWDRVPFIVSTDLDNPSNGEASYNGHYSYINDNFIICNYGGSQAFDTDDGSSYYNIFNNFLYQCDGLKMDYGGHDMKFHDNIVITYPYDGQNCLNFADFNNNGPGDQVWGNKCVLMGCNNKDCVDNLGSIAQCFVGSPAQMWNNEYFSKHGNGSFGCWNGTHFENFNITQMQNLYQMEIGSNATYLPSNQTIVNWAKTLFHL